jgi:hypothetical protein
MTDHEIHDAIAHAIAQPDTDGLAALIAVRDQLRAERPLDPALGAVWDAVVSIARREPERLVEIFELSEARARWLTLARGPSDPATIRAWGELGALADLEYDREVATRAWEAIAAAPIDLDGVDPAVLHEVSLAMRGLAASRKADGRIDDARRLFERDLALNERMHRHGHAQLALSLGNLAGHLAQLGEVAPAAALRQCQRDVLVAIGASAGQLQAVDAQLAKLKP